MSPLNFTREAHVFLLFFSLRAGIWGREDLAISNSRKVSTWPVEIVVLIFCGKYKASTNVVCSGEI